MLRRIMFAGLAAAAISLVVGSAFAEESRLEDQSHLFEFGLFGGVFLPDADNHEFHKFPDVEQQPLKSVIPEIGLRIGYLPIPYFGIEGEAAVLPASTENDDSALLYALRGHLIGQLALGRWAPFLVGGAGGLGVMSEDDSLGNDIDFAWHWGLGVKYYPTDWLDIRLDGRHSIAPEVGPGGLVNHFEVLLGVSMVLGWADPDSDGDGIIDDNDKCPHEYAETDDGCPLPPPDSDGDGIIDDNDKCPNVFAETEDGCPPDRDGDGVIDEKDACPDIPAETPDGCPPDTDGDGLRDDLDKCPEVAAKTEDGCPPPDSDGDGIIDADDKCIDVPENKNGYQDGDGCPDEIPKIVKQFTGAIEGITFQLDKADIRKSSFKTLDKAIKVLKDYPEIELIIAGHTDNQGDHDYNVDLSQRRAQAVKDYMVSKGIGENRLGVEGHGPDKPVADNETKKGRAQNRRIEFSLR